jgi:hypothetical protein
VVGLVVGGTCRFYRRLQTRVQGVVGSPSISESVMGVLDHFTAAITLDLAALLALVITSFCDFIFRALSTR